MYKGKHVATASAHKSKVKNPAAAIIALILVVVLAAGGTVAYLTTHTQELTNIFSPAEVMAEVSEGNNGIYTIKNAGDVSAYLRVAVVANWTKGLAVVDAVTNTSTVYWKQPAFTVDYDGDWFKGSDGFYYYKKPVAAKTAIPDELIVTLANGQATPSGYEFSVTVLAEAIQSEPAEAVSTSWGVSVNGNVISK